MFHQSDPAGDGERDLDLDFDLDLAGDPEPDLDLLLLLKPLLLRDCLLPLRLRLPDLPDLLRAGLPLPDREPDLERDLEPDPDLDPDLLLRLRLPPLSEPVFLFLPPAPLSLPLPL